MRLTGSLYCQRRSASTLFLIFFSKTFQHFRKTLQMSTLHSPKKLPNLPRIAQCLPISRPQDDPCMTLDQPKDCPNHRQDDRLPGRVASPDKSARTNAPNSAPCLTALTLPCFVLLRRLPCVHARLLTRPHVPAHTHACAYARMRHHLYICYLLFCILSLFFVSCVLVSICLSARPPSPDAHIHPSRRLSQAV